MTQELERVKLQRKLIAVGKRLDKVRERLEQTQDPEETADCRLLIDLHQRHYYYIEAEIELPGFRRELEECEAAYDRWEDAYLQARAKKINPPPPPFPSWGTGRRHPAAIDRHIQRCEGWIRDWHRRLPEWKEIYEYVRANFRARGVTPPGEELSQDKPPAQPAPEIWEGTVRSFGDFVMKEYEEGKIPEATSATKAFEIMCKRYAQRNGKPLNPASVRQNLRNRKTEGK